MIDRFYANRYILLRIQEYKKKCQENIFYTTQIHEFVF